MERMRVLWIPSGSDFVEKRQLLGIINGAAAVVLEDNLASSANQVLHDYPTDAVCEVWTRVFGDNGTTKDSAHLTFTASNQESVEADTGLTVQWVEHIA